MATYNIALFTITIFLGVIAVTLVSIHQMIKEFICKAGEPK